MRLMGRVPRSRLGYDFAQLILLTFIRSHVAALGTPWNVDITGDRAYFVAPMTYSYTQHGKTVKESATFAVALKRTQAGGASPPGHTLSSKTVGAALVI